MSDFEESSSDSELGESDQELQAAFSSGLVKPGLNIVQDKKTFPNDVKQLTQKRKEIVLNLPWLETLECVNDVAPLAPELAAQMTEHQQKRQNQLKNNKKLPQFDPSEDPVLNDFKREMIFHRQAQAAVLEALPKLKALGLATKRPDDYFAEMAKTDAHMQKIREKLMQQQAQQQNSERVKQLRIQRKEGKALQSQAKVERQKEKKEMLDQVKRVRKGLSKDTSFLSGKGGKGKAIERRKIKDKKFGFGGKKRGLKTNTQESADDINEYRRPPGGGGKGKFNSKGKGGAKFNTKTGAKKRLGKNRRQKNKKK